MADPNSLPFSTSASGDTTVIAAPADSRGIAFIRVLGYEITANETTTVTVVSGQGTFPRRTLDTLNCVAGGGAMAPDATGGGFGGTFDCDPGSPLIINNSTPGVTVSGRVRYTVVGAG